MNIKPLVLNNGIYLQSREYDHKSHLDKAHVMHLNQGNPMAKDLGIIEPFVTSGFLQTPYLYGSFNVDSQRIEVPSGVYKWSYPLHDEPMYIVEDLSQHSKPGIAGEKFKIKVNQKKYDNGYVLAVDQHSPEQLLVTEDEIYQDGDGWVITVKYVGVDPANRWFPKQYLKPKTKLFPITTVGTEYSQMYSSIPTFSGGMREYMNYVGQTNTQLHYEVTRDAAFSMVDKKCLASMDAHREIIEMYKFKPGTTGHDLSLNGQEPRSLAQAYTKKYGSKAAKQMQYDTIQKAWIPKIEALGMQYINYLCEVEAIFGSGGQISYDGKTKANRSIGLFHQLNMGNQYNFNIYDFTYAKLENIIAERLKDRVDPFHSTYNVTIRVGRGMYTLLRNQLSKLPGEAGVQFHAKDMLSNYGGDNTQVKYNPLQVTSWNMLNGYGTISMELIPGLDPTEANEAINPKVPVAAGVGAHRLSSYMIIIEDITNNTQGNIVELVHGHDWDFQKRVITGKLNYLGAPTFNNGTFNSASHHPGYQMFMEKKDKAYWVKDITKSLLIKPINPLTGRPIYDGFYK